MLSLTVSALQTVFDSLPSEEQAKFVESLIPRLGAEAVFRLTKCVEDLWSKRVTMLERLSLYKGFYRGEVTAYDLQTSPDLWLVMKLCNGEDVHLHVYAHRRGLRLTWRGIFFYPGFEQDECHGVTKYLHPCMILPWNRLAEIVDVLETKSMSLWDRFQKVKEYSIQYVADDTNIIHHGYQPDRDKDLVSACTIDVTEDMINPKYITD